MEYRIGQFSLITRFSVKTLRYYHEIGLLEPSRTEESGYRFYDDSLVERARLISLLRELDVPLAEVAQIVDRVESGDPIDEVISTHANRIDSQIVHLERIRSDINRFMTARSAGSTAAKIDRTEGGGPRTNACEIRSIAAELVVSSRFTGSYPESGAVFEGMAREAGPAISGGPFSLYWKAEHAPEEADIEPCFPVSRVFDSRTLKNGFEMGCRVVPDARCLATVHRGPYQMIGDAYGRLFRRMDELSFELVLPIRERYLRGPGMGLAPDEFLTEVAVEVSG